MGKWLPIISRVVTKVIFGDDPDRHWNVVQNNGRVPCFPGEGKRDLQRSTRQDDEDEMEHNPVKWCAPQLSMTERGK